MFVQLFFFCSTSSRCNFSMGKFHHRTCIIMQHDLQWCTWPRDGWARSLHRNLISLLSGDYASKTNMSGCVFNNLQTQRFWQVSFSSRTENKRTCKALLKGGKHMWRVFQVTTRHVRASLCRNRVLRSCKVADNGTHHYEPVLSTTHASLCEPSLFVTRMCFGMLKHPPVTSCMLDVEMLKQPLCCNDKTSLVPNCIHLWCWCEINCASRSQKLIFELTYNLRCFQKVHLAQSA